MDVSTVIQDFSLISRGGSLLRIATTIVLSAMLAMPSAMVIHAEPDAGVVGNGTPASCTEAALTTALAGGGTVTFDCGGPATILLLTTQTITQPTAIDGGGVITLTGGLATQLFLSLPDIALEMRNITLDSARNTVSSGGAIRAFGALTLTNVTIQNSASVFCGGAVLVAADALIRDSTFDKNSAVLGGGAVCTRTTAGNTVQVRDSMFTNNQSMGAFEGFGGAMYVDTTSKVSVTDSAFTGNSARVGGAVHVGPLAALEMRGTPTDTLFAGKLRFANNSAKHDGGALANAGVLSVSHALLTQNHALTNTESAGQGGGIYNEGALTLRNALLSQNEGRLGGGVFVGTKDGAEAVIERTSFIRNISNLMGGGLFAERLTTVTISDSAFHRNTTRANGGGLARMDAKLAVYNTSFTNNLARDGGGMFVYTAQSQTADNYIPVHSSTFSGNTASSNKGGGIYNGAHVALVNTTITGNTNGVFASFSSNMRFRNTVLNNPGALNCDGPGTAAITDDGNNFSTDKSCILPNSRIDPTLDPGLGPLTVDTVGVTSYRMPLAGGPLIDKGASCPPHDQLGRARVGECDIGAVEFGTTQPPATPSPGPPTPTPTTTVASSAYLPLVQR